MQKKNHTFVRLKDVKWSCVIPRAFEVNETHRIGQSATKYSRNLTASTKTARKNSHQNATTLFPLPAERALELSVNNISVDGPQWGGDEENEKFRKKASKRITRAKYFACWNSGFPSSPFRLFPLPHNPLFAASTSSPLSAVLWRRNISRSEKKSVCMAMRVTPEVNYTRESLAWAFSPNCSRSSLHITTGSRSLPTIWRPNTFPTSRTRHFVSIKKVQYVLEEFFFCVVAFSLTKISKHSLRTPKDGKTLHLGLNRCRRPTLWLLGHRICTIWWRANALFADFWLILISGSDDEIQTELEKR